MTNNSIRQFGLYTKDFSEKESGKASAKADLVRNSDFEGGLKESAAIYESMLNGSPAQLSKAETRTIWKKLANIYSDLGWERSAQFARQQVLWI